jgi:hypothetical protein
MQYNLRPLKQEEYSLLEDFLYDAIFVPVGEEALPRSVCLNPPSKLLSGFWKGA